MMIAATRWSMPPGTDPPPMAKSSGVSRYIASASSIDVMGLSAVTTSAA
jgi:hypothetical protein